MTEALFLVQMDFDVGAAMRSMQRVPRDLDVGYLAHCHLTGVFGKEAPKPFALQVEHDGGVRRLLAYSERGREELMAMAREAMPAPRFEAMRWDGLAAKKMPAQIPTGTRLGFEVRVCPVVRLAKAREVARGDEREVVRKGSERDVYQREAWEAERNGEVFLKGREEVYREWLKRQLAGAAEVESAGLVRFTQRERLFRQTQGDVRKERVLERPDVVLRGTLRVDDAAGFRQILRRGVGRHRAFGFGMLLVRPPEPEC